MKVSHGQMWHWRAPRWQIWESGNKTYTWKKMHVCFQFLKISAHKQLFCGAKFFFLNEGLFIWETPLPLPLAPAPKFFSNSINFWTSKIKHFVFGINGFWHHKERNFAAKSQRRIKYFRYYHNYKTPTHLSFGANSIIWLLSESIILLFVWSCWIKTSEKIM